MIRKLLLGFFGVVAWVGVANAQTCTALPYTLSNGTPADATQVMANYTHLLNCVNTALAGTGEQGFSLINGGVNASVASNALTVSIKTQAGTDPSSGDSVKVLFRNAAASNGGYSLATLTAATSFTVSSGSTLGATNNSAFALWLIGFDDGGTFRLGLINCADATKIYPLQAEGLRSTSAEGGAGAADSAGVIYTGTAVTSKPFRILARFEWSSGLATAGTWSVAPSIIELHKAGMKMPGDIVQTVYASTTTQSSTTSNVYQATALSAAITPTSAANRIRFSCTVSVQVLNGANGGRWAVQRSGSTIGMGLQLYAGDQLTQNAFTLTGFEQPNSASALTYTLMQRSGLNGVTVQLLLIDGNTAQITIDEVRV